MTKLSVIPFMDVVPHGVFSTRPPLRPNHIGLSIVELLGRQANELIARGVDILDGTPLLEFKPIFSNLIKWRIVVQVGSLQTMKK